MAKTLLAHPAPTTTADYEAEFEVLMQEANSISERMSLGRVEINHLKAEGKVLAKETGRLKDETRAMLVSMGRRYKPCGNNSLTSASSTLVLPAKWTSTSWT